MSVVCLIHLDTYTTACSASVRRPTHEDHEDWFSVYPGQVTCPACLQSHDFDDDDYLPYQRAIVARDSLQAAIEALLAGDTTGFKFWLARAGALSRPMNDEPAHG